MKYKVVIQENAEGFSVHCPGLPGCWSQGNTEDEAVSNISDAIVEYLAAVDDITKNDINHPNPIKIIPNWLNFIPNILLAKFAEFNSQWNLPYNMDSFSRQ